MGPGWAVRLAAGSGLLALTGPPDGPPVVPPSGLVATLIGLTDAIRMATAAAGNAVALSWAEVVAGRAALLGLSRQGSVSANGTCRLLPTADGWAALSLARPDDRDAVAALVAPWPGRGRPDGPGGGPDGDGAEEEAWARVAGAAVRAPTADLVARARLLGLAAAGLPREAAPATGEAARASGGPPREAALARRLPWRRVALGTPAPPRPLAGLQVVDCSALWAGPLTAAVLAGAGATVVKVEAADRPDGARAHPAVYRWLHPPDQPEVTVDLGSDRGRDRLRALLASADVVIESARPRALAQLGAGPHQVPARPGRVWLGISGHGRRAPGRHWVAFGDDAAVAGGLVAWAAPGEPVFVGDAVADPLTGLWGALAVLRALAVGGGCLLDLSMADGAAAVMGAPAGGAPPAFGGDEAWSGWTGPPATPVPGGWAVTVDGDPVPVAPPARPTGFVAGR